MSEVLRGEWELAGWKSRSKAFQTKVTAPEEASCVRMFLQSGTLMNCGGLQYSLGNIFR